jgi:hypothetical protein
MADGELLLLDLLPRRGEFVLVGPALDFGRTRGTPAGRPPISRGRSGRLRRRLNYQQNRKDFLPVSSRSSPIFSLAVKNRREDRKITQPSGIRLLRQSLALAAANRKLLGSSPMCLAAALCLFSRRTRTAFALSPLAVVARTKRRPLSRAVCLALFLALFEEQTARGRVS